MGGWETLHSPATRAQSFSEPGPLGCELSSPHWRQDRAARVGQSRLSPFPRSVRPPAGRGLGASLLPRADILRKNRVLWCVSKKKTIRPHGKTHTNVGKPWSVGRSDLSVCPLQRSVSYSGGFPSWTPAPVALSAGDCLLWGAATPCLASLSLSAEGEGGGLPCVTASLADPGRKPLLFQSVRTAC